MLSVMLSVTIMSNLLSAIMLSVIMLSVAVPFVGLIDSFFLLAIIQPLSTLKH